MKHRPEGKARAPHARTSRFGLRFFLRNRFFLFAGCATLALFLLGTSGLAQSNVSGSLSGKADAGSSISIESVDTGFQRTSGVASDGTFRVVALPPGFYKVTVKDGLGAPRAQIVEVGLGTNKVVDFAAEATVTLDKFVVSGAATTPIDFAKTESVSIFTAAQLQTLPVARTTTDVALQAPGTVPGDLAFGNLASFGGASVAENAYFINGFNVSDFRRGIDPGTVPFEAYDQFEIKTGAYSAEFGRSLGGVINATTKSGTNHYAAGFNVYWTPDASYAHQPDVYYRDNFGVTAPWLYNSRDERSDVQTNIYAGGPLFKNRLFFYGLYNFRNEKTGDVINAGNTFRKTTADDPFWLLKFDANVLPGQKLEYTDIKNKSTTVGTQTDFDFATKRDRGTNSVTNWNSRGGNLRIAHYTGTFFDQLTLSALFGRSTQALSDLSSKDLEPLVYDRRSGALVQLAGTSSVTGQVSTGGDEREALRFDLTYDLSLWGHHQLRAGFDREKNTSLNDTQYSGGVYWRYSLVTPGSVLDDGIVPAGVTEVARKRVYRRAGSFDVNSNALYVEDNWSLMKDRWLFRVGLRNESFENFNLNRESFIKIDRQLAPRLGASYDLFGDKKTKVFANYGRYHIPVASNTNVQLSGGELFTQDYYALNSVNADGTPKIGAQIGTQTVFSDGTIPDKKTIVAEDIKPMYQDEYMIGVQQVINRQFTAGVRFIYRDLKSTMEDMIIDNGLTAWAQANGFPGYSAKGSKHYILGNPGSSMKTSWDFNGDGVNEEVNLTAAELGYPKAVRKYASAELFLEKIWDGRWTAQFSYTWAHSYGNTEGWVLSDNGQDDAGATLQFDSPDLTKGSYGNLANDRRHAFKLFGSYAINREWQAGFNLRLSSGRPINKFGWVNDSILGTSEGAAYFSVPRGKAGTTPWVLENNFSLRYQPKWSWAKARLNFTADVFNLLNRKTVTEVVETAYIDLANTPDVTYLLPTAFQTPRRFRFSVGVDF